MDPVFTLQRGESVACEPWVLGDHGSRHALEPGASLSPLAWLASQMTMGWAGINRCACDAIRVQPRNGQHRPSARHHDPPHSLRVHPGSSSSSESTGSNTSTSDSATSGITCELGRATALPSTTPGATSTTRPLRWPAPPA